MGDDRGAETSGGARVLADGDLRLTLDASHGPRVTSLTGVDGEELMVELSPPLVIGPPEGPRLALHGGHRLWAAPEVPAVTYALATGGGTLRTDGDHVRVGDEGTPIARRIVVAVADGEVRLRHTLVNTGTDVRAMAPWAITQLQPGGIVCMPVGAAPSDEHGLQASGAIVTWPYTRLDDPRIAMAAHAVTIDSGGMTSEDDPVKLGVDGSVPWAAYVRGPSVFVLRGTPPPRDAPLVDLGATVQSYVCGDFVELELLGPLTEVAPGGSVTLDEVWSVHRRTWAEDEPLADHVRPLVPGA